MNQNSWNEANAIIVTIKTHFIQYITGVVHLNATGKTKNPAVAHLKH